MEILIVIPARGGSKGVHRKNIREVSGKPLISWTIDAAIKSNVTEHIFVSTEDSEIARISEAYGAKVIKRPNLLAQDESKTIDVVKHAISVVEAKLKIKFEYIFLLQPTCPLIEADDIRLALSALKRSCAKSLISVYKVEDAHPARMYRVEKNRLISISEGGSAGLRRQELTEVYHRNGAIYACVRSVVFNDNALWDSSPAPLIMPKARSINIDDEQDLVIANALMSLRK
jgi:CMP-N,N'-diacetyllegionaminic acid synthase